MKDFGLSLAEPTRQSRAYSSTISKQYENRLGAQVNAVNPVAHLYSFGQEFRKNLFAMG